MKPYAEERNLIFYSKIKLLDGKSAFSLVPEAGGEVFKARYCFERRNID
jgi:hypothetical protein